MFDGIQTESIDAHLFLVPNQPATHLIAHVIGRLRRIESGVGALSESARIVANVRSPITGTDIATGTVMTWIIMKILPILWESSGAWKIVGRIIFCGRSGETNVTEVGVLVVPAGWILSSRAVSRPGTGDMVQHSESMSRIQCRKNSSLSTSTL